ncbi:MAG: tetratricopeptide repeat protein [Burkholderiaceae bacterium]|nr:tetratricopeptide repeat protein [Burkholderiaceae bacterium]
MQDCFGNPVTLADTGSLLALNDFVEGFAACQLRVLKVLDVAALEPGVLVQAYAAALHLFAETPQAPTQAQPFLDRALNPLRPATPRERQFALAVQAWAQGEVDQALARLEALLREHPRDLVALKLAQVLAFNLGDSPRMLRLALLCRAAAADVSYLHGMLAFGYEQCHWMPEAEASARRALAIQPSEPWAQHALAHVMLTQGRLTEGRDFMQAASPGWQGLNSFMETHNWWHLALFHLELGELDAVLKLYDQQVWGVAPDYSQDQINAVSLLARIELAGGDVGQRWQALSPFLVPRVRDQVLPFLDLHYLYGLVRAGRQEADVLLRNLIRFAPLAPAAQRGAWLRVAVPAGRGLLAHARGRFEEAVDQLGRALPRLIEIGGSHAQCELFEQIYIDALLQAGRYGAAQNLLQPRLNASPGSRRLQRQVGELNRSLGL